jgi:hypothetical protein
MTDFTAFCKLYQNNFSKLDDFRILQCDYTGKPFITKCDDGYRYFDSNQCESSACVGQPNGTRIPLPDETDNSFRFSPGYSECFDDRVIDIKRCPRSWDPHLSKGDNLTHLPMVFNGNTCAVPEFCTNVTSDDPNTIVPVHEFTKHVRNWKNSSLFDSVYGYRCEGGQRKRVATSPGQIVSKKFKTESGCVYPIERLVTSSFDTFFDCNSQTVVKCDQGKFFDGRECRLRISHAHAYRHIDLFRFDNLNYDGWILPFDYSKEISSQPCTAPEDVFLETFNV